MVKWNTSKLAYNQKRLASLASTAIFYPFLYATFFFSLVLTIGQSYDEPRQHIKKRKHHFANSACFCCSVDKSYLTLCNPINYSTPAFLVLHYLPEFAEAHVH